MKEDKKAKTFDKIGNYLRQTQLKQKKQNEKVMRLRLKNMAEKTASVGDGSTKWKRKQT